jgi:hypothetical protein
MNQDQWIDLGLYASYILLGIALVAAIVMNLANAVKDPRSLIKGVAGIVLLGIIFLIGYSMAPDVLDAAAIRAFEAAEMDITADSTKTTYKLVGGAMTTTLVLVVVAVVGLVYSSVAKLIG